jgi:hypothetical protein
MVAPVAGAAVAAGAEILKMLLQIATTDEGVAWIGRKMKDKLPALRTRVRALKHVRVGGRDV